MLVFVCICVVSTQNCDWMRDKPLFGIYIVENRLTFDSQYVMLYAYYVREIVMHIIYENNIILHLNTIPRL